MKTPRPLPFQPQPLDHLRTRYQAAIQPLYDAQRVATVTPEDRPSLKRRHVFDCEDGMRLIISRERMPSQEEPVPGWVIGIHMSASLELERALGRELQVLKGDARFDAFLQRAVARWQELAGRPVHAEFIGLMEGLVPHWFERSVS